MERFVIEQKDKTTGKTKTFKMYVPPCWDNGNSRFTVVEIENISVEVCPNCNEKKMVVDDGQCHCNSCGWDN